MKRKITILLMALLLIIPFSGKKIAADDKLPAPSNLRMDGNVLKWDAVEGADAYAVATSAIKMSNTYAVVEDATAYDLVEAVLNYPNGSQYVELVGDFTATVWAFGDTPETNSDLVELNYYVKEVGVKLVDYESSQGHIENFSFPDSATEASNYLAAAQGSDIVLKVAPADGYTFENPSSYQQMGVTYDTSNNVIRISGGYDGGAIQLRFVKETAKVSVTVEFGSGHEELLANGFAALSDDAKKDLEVNGSKLIVKNVPENMTVRDFIRNHDALIDDIIGDIDEDNGELFLTVSLKDEFQTEEDADQSEGMDSTVKEVSTVYVFWIKYNVISGENQTWIIGSNKDLSFTLKRNFFDAGFGDGQYFLFPPTADTLASVEVDGTALSDSDYTAAPGSIKISLKPSFPNTLSKGTHTLKVSFTASDEPYGYKEIEFKVADKGSDGPYSVPDTCTK